MMTLAYKKYFNKLYLELIRQGIVRMSTGISFGPFIYYIK